MDKKKNKIVSSILEGRKKAIDSYNEYKNLSFNKPETISIDYSLLVNRKYDDFRVKLYNYMNAIKNKKVYFENFDSIEEKLNYIPEGLKKKNYIHYLKHLDIRMNTQRILNMKMIIYYLKNI